MIPMRTVARLKMRLRNHRILTRIALDEGINLGIARLCVVAVPFVLPSSWARIRSKRSLVMMPESCLSPLYDSIMKAVTTAENRPALNHSDISFET